MRTEGFDRNGFLKHAFLPFNGYAFTDWRRAEKEFFRSADHLCKLYNLERPDTSGLPFPMNMTRCHQHITEGLQRDNNLTCQIMQDDTRMATLVTAKRFDTGYTLYYIPVKAICRVMNVAELKPLGDLLIATCAYLYQVTQIDYYRDYNYIHSTYATIEDWMNEEEYGDDQNYKAGQQEEMQKMKQFGDVFLEIIKRPFHPNSFRKLVKAYHNSNCPDKGFTGIGEEIGKLITDYPKRSLYASVPRDYYACNESGHIHIEQYLSFYWSGNDQFNEVFFDMVNNDLQESGDQIEPLALQWFDTPQEKESHVFDYEPRLFAILSELIDFLTDYDHDNEHH